MLKGVSSPGKTTVTQAFLSMRAEPCIYSGFDD